MRLRAEKVAPVGEHILKSVRKRHMWGANPHPHSRRDILNFYKEFLKLGYSKQEAKKLAALARSYREQNSGDEVGQGLRILAVDLAKPSKSLSKE